MKADAEKKAAFFATEAPTHFANIDKQLAATGVAGVTIADIYLYHLIKHAISDAADAAALAGAATPGVHASVSKVAANAGVASWEAGRAACKEVF